jgi:hypothetical protein
MNRSRGSMLPCKKQSMPRMKRKRMPDDKTLMTQIERMDQRIEAATKEWEVDRQKLTAEIEAFRDKLATTIGKLFAAEQAKTTLAGACQRVLAAYNPNNPGQIEAAARDVETALRKTGYLK